MGTTARRLLLLLPLILWVASVILLASSPLSWGAAEVLDVPDWAPPLVGAVVALGSMWIALFSFRTTTRATRGDFEVFPLQLVFGSLMFLSGAATMLTLAVQLPNPDTYVRVIEEDPEVTVGATEIVVVSLLTGLLSIGCVWIGAYLYSHAITNMLPNRISARHADEVDGIGELLRRQR